MSRSNTPPTDPQIIAALHPVGTRWRAVVGRFEDDRLRVLAHREFNQAEASRIDQWLVEQRAGRLLSVLPASSVVCRTTSLPLADPSQLEPALRLQAESQFLGTAPAHRLAIAVLDPAPGETGRSGLMLAWPESSNPPRPPVARAIAYVPDVACLAAMMNGRRSDQPLVWADREDGSLALAVSHPQGVVYRAICETSETPDVWRDSIGRVVMETALSVGHTPDFARHLVQWTRARMNGAAEKPSALVVPDELAGGVRERVLGSGDDGWWATFGVAVGALLATRGGLAAFTRLSDLPPSDSPSVIDRVVRSFSRPRVAAGFVIAAIVMLAFSPLLFAGVRVLAFNAKVGDLKTYLANSAASEQQAALYSVLQRETWPMTKLLAELGAATPLRITLDTITLDHGKPFSVRGEAESTTQVLEMVALLKDSGVFDEVVPSWEYRDPTSAKLTFTINAKVASPHRRAANLPDYAEESASDRLYGRRVTTPPAGTGSNEAARPVATGQTPPSGSTTGSTPGGSASGSTPGGPARPAGTGSTEAARPVATGQTPPSGSTPGSAATPRPPAGTSTNTTNDSSATVLDEQGRPARTAPRTAPVRVPNQIVNENAEQRAADAGPPTYTADQINEMTRDRATEALAEVSRAIARAGISDDVRASLREQQRHLMARMRGTTGSGGSRDD